MPIVNQTNTSRLGLIRNGFNPQQGQPAWGYVNPTDNLNPAASTLQNTYSVNSVPRPMRLINFNRNGISTVRPESILDELDTRAPNLNPVGVVSQIYKSSIGRQYKQLGPRDGRY